MYCHPQPIEVVRDSIASTYPPRAAVRCRSRPTPLRRNSLPMRRRPLPMRATPSRRNSLHASPSAADRDQLHHAETPSMRRRPLPNSCRTPSRQKTTASRHEFKDALRPSHDGLRQINDEVCLSISREEVDRAPHGKKSHLDPLWVNTRIIQNPWR